MTCVPTAGERMVLSAVARALALAALCGVMACAGTSASDEEGSESVLRFVPQSDLQILDTVWSTAAVTRNHGLLIYDTLFGMDSKGQITPQMVETFELSADRKIWTFTLRPGLEFHDGAPVTSHDVIASLRRWAQRDNMGLVLWSFVEKWEAVDDKTFRIVLNKPYGMMLETLGKVVGSAPFIMPKHVASTPGDNQLENTTGSGPFIFKRDEWRPGEKVVYVKNPRYRPRPERADGTAGGKVAKVDRVEWIIIRDPQTQASALAAGEVDVIESPAYEQYASLKDDPDIQLVQTNRLGNQNILRFNHLEAPFDNPKIRQAAMAALNQPEFLQAQVGIPSFYHVCFSIYPCNTAYSTSKGMDFIANPNPEEARRLLRESGYRGESVVILQPTDHALMAKPPMVVAQLLRRAGFTVDLQSMAYNTLLSRRAKKDGWSIFTTYSMLALNIDPVVNLALSGACEKAWFGWPCDAELESLRSAFAVAGTEKERKTLAERIQVRAMESGVYVPLGEFIGHVAARKSVSGFVPALGGVVLWNIEKN